VGVHNLI